MRVDRPSPIPGNDYVPMVSRQPTTEELFELDRKDYTLPLPERTLLSSDLDAATRLERTYEKQVPQILAREAVDRLAQQPAIWVRETGVPVPDYQIPSDVLGPRRFRRNRSDR